MIVTVWLYEIVLKLTHRGFKTEGVTIACPTTADTARLLADSLVSSPILSFSMLKWAKGLQSKAHVLFSRGH